MLSDAAVQLRADWDEAGKAPVHLPKLGLRLELWLRLGLRLRPGPG